MEEYLWHTIDNMLAEDDYPSSVGIRPMIREAHAELAALREENARLRGWVAQLCERIEEQWPTGTDASTDAAAARKYLATQAPEARGESGEAP